MKAAPRAICPLLVLSLMTVSITSTLGGDWARFRGPNGSGVNTEEKSVPAEWSDSKNLKWKAELPGPGSSCPIVVGDRVLVTCWSGYADGSGEEGSMENLKRHLVCLDRATGRQRWLTTVDAVLPEQPYSGQFAENGYTSNTPVSDGEVVIAFFGKSGVHAYDLDGKELWSADVGDEINRWGSSSSPIIHKDVVIVTASSESHSLVALDRKTGKEVWKQEAEGLDGTYGTPILVDTGERTELVISVPNEFWALNPETGKMLWYCESIDLRYVCSSVVADEGVLYAIDSGPGGGGAVAIVAGGEGDVSSSKVLWNKSHSSRIATPVVHDNRMYCVNSGTLTCIDSKTGDRIYQNRLQADSSAATDDDDGQGQGRGDRRGGGRRGGRDYSSPVIADGKLFYTDSSGQTFVVKLGDDFQQLAVNRFESASGQKFHATPAISDGQLFIRGERTVYCVAAD